MITKYKIREFEWVDVDSPTQEEVAKIAEEYKISGNVSKDMSSPTPRPRVYDTGDFLYAVMHIPVFKHSHSGEEISQEIDFVIGEKVLITTRYDTIDALHRFAKEAEVEEALERNGAHSKHPFFGLIREIHKSIFDELAWNGDWISDIEKKIFSGFEKEMVLALSKAGRNILNFKKIINPHKNALAWIFEAGSEKFGKGFKTEMHGVLTNSNHLLEAIYDQDELVQELRETNNSLLSTKQNEIMKILTILAMITLPASIIAGIFNMNTSLPIVGHPNDFYIVMGIMVVASFSMFMFFKYKKWL